MIELGEAHTLSDLVEAAHSAEMQLSGQVWFRGHAQSDWQLVPSAHRRHPILEAQLAHHFRLRAPALSTDCPGHKDYVSWLPLMQHYGLPTRLLDWTESLMVATFFAILPKQIPSKASIWFLAPGNLNEQSIGYIIPFLTDERITPLITGAFTGKTNPDYHYSVAALAPRTDRRMAAQLGNYTLHGTREALEAHPNSSRFLARIFIPSISLSKIKSDLSVSGMKRSSLFPDLSNLAQELAEFRAFGPNGEDLELQIET